ncbi:MAG TPA: hypothetical protein VJ779_18905, partial [Acetobacteraceae bacterium]|nr:hypothetical protein [Acetobacteraceae bacterium]
MLIIDRARLEREALVYFLNEWASDLSVRAIEAIAAAAKERCDPPDLIILVSLKAADHTAIRQASFELETIFGRKTPMILILQGDSSPSDELQIIRLGMQGCFPASLSTCMLIS